MNDKSVCLIVPLFDANVLFPVFQQTLRHNKTYITL